MSSLSICNLWMLWRQLYCHPRGDSTTIAPTVFTQLGVAVYKSVYHLSVVFFQLKGSLFFDDCMLHAHAARTRSRLFK